MKRTLGVNRKYPKVLPNRKAGIARRLAPRNGCDQPQPMFQGGKLHYDVTDRTKALVCGGLGGIPPRWPSAWVW